MGRTTTPKYRLRYSYISFTEKCRKTATEAWNCKSYGRPTVENLKRWRSGFNQSLINGANKHLNGIMSGAGTCQIEYNTKGGAIVAIYKPPMFEII